MIYKKRKNHFIDLQNWKDLKSFNFKSFKFIIKEYSSRETNYPEFQSRKKYSQKFLWIGNHWGVKFLILFDFVYNKFKLLLIISLSARKKIQMKVIVLVLILMIWWHIHMFLSFVIEIIITLYPLTYFRFRQKITKRLCSTVSGFLCSSLSTRMLCSCRSTTTTTTTRTTRSSRTTRSTRASRT